MTTELDTKVTDFVQRVCSAMGLNIALEVEETPDHLRVNLTGDDADELLHEDGEALDALQVIVNTAFGRDARGDRHYVIDAVGFRRGKDDELRREVEDLMKSVRETGAPESIGPLNPYARRIVHMTVAEDAALASGSTGDTFLKTVVISRKA